MVILSKLALLWLVAALGVLGACASVARAAADREPSIHQRPFGRTREGVPATLYELRGGGELVARLTDFGATLVSLEAPDRAGARADVVLGFDDVSGYESDANQWIGCTVGRVANRIRAGRFTLDGREHVLEVNDPPNHLHGGSRGLSFRTWTAEPSTSSGAARVRFTTVSPAGEGGYPGRLAVAVTYTLTAEDELRIDYEARADAATPVSLTNHSYFQLAGAGAPTVLDHVLEIAASRVTAVDDTLIPTGELADVSGSPLDFRAPHALGERIAALDGPPTHGYDHNYVLHRPAREGDLVLAARLVHPTSGRMLELSTTQPGLQLYSGNHLHGQRGKDGLRYARRSAVCLEPQHFPDSVHQPSFPSTILQPGRVWRHSTVYRFSVR